MLTKLATIHTVHLFPPSFLNSFAPGYEVVLAPLSSWSVQSLICIAVLSDAKLVVMYLRLVQVMLLPGRSSKSGCSKLYAGGDKRWHVPLQTLRKTVLIPSKAVTRNEFGLCILGVPHACSHMLPDTLGRVDLDGLRLKWAKA